MRAVTTKNHPVFFVSDSTAITVETLGRGVLSQFPDISTDVHTYRFIDTMEKLVTVCTAVEYAHQQSGIRPLVFASLVEQGMRTQLHTTSAQVMDVLQTFVAAIAQTWQTPATPRRGQSHGQVASANYPRRMQAVHFALACDDGAQTQQYDEAEVILLGVSRTSKTPTALYLALHYSLFVANYPLVAEDLARTALPTVLQSHRHKLIGLTITPRRLHDIREERRPHSEYASLAQCESEVRRMETLYIEQHILYLDVTSRSVEEVAGTILHLTRPSPG
jgi:hypothetical protein